jgi:ribosome-associated heat shock protein Hsp15
MTVISLSGPILPDWKWSSLRDDRQRIDKWLWHARLVRTRSAAAALAASGHVRLNGARIAAPAKPVKAGDVVTIALDARVRILKVTGFALRRGAAEAGRALYEDLAPAEPAPAEERAALAGAREPGSGRPTKQDRRAIARFTRGHDS